MIKVKGPEMTDVATLRGMTTFNVWADDVAAAVEWYSRLLGVSPYFARSSPDGEPAYVEFRFGDRQSELSVVDRRYAPPSAVKGPGGPILYWHVDDVTAVWNRLLAMGAGEYQPITTRGEGFVTAAVVDPFGNVLGIMYNAHYLSMLHIEDRKEGRA